MQALRSERKRKDERTSEENNVGEEDERQTGQGREQKEETREKER